MFTTIYFKSIIFFIFILVTYLYCQFFQYDTFINLTFSRNLIENSKLVFNLNEPVNALTTPLWFFVSLLFMKISQTISGNYDMTIPLMKISS